MEDLKRGGISLSLEYVILHTAILLTIVASFFFFIIDTFIAHEYLSSLVGLISILVPSIFYYLLYYRNVHLKLTNWYVGFLLVLANAAWLTGGGFNMINAFVFLLIMIVTSLVAPKRARKFFVLMIFLDILLLGLLEYFDLGYIRPIHKEGPTLTYSLIMFFISMGVTTYFIIFFKSKYDEEHALLQQKNLELDKKNAEIEMQNEELIQGQEEISSQRDYINHNNKKLKDQAEDLKKANVIIRTINQSLEMKVNERTAELMSINKDIDELFYRSSHDFRRPLTTLMGLQEVARLSIKDDFSRELFSKVQNTAVSMDKMLTKFLMLYSINHFQQDRNEVSLTETLVKIEKLCQQQENIQFHLEVKIQNYSNLDSRNKLIEIVLSNLVENALIYRKKEGTVIELKIYEEKDKINIQIMDNGLGIPREYHKKVFDMYFRGSVISDGNGLGLYVVKKAMDALKADIQLQSEPLQFTRFDISFNI